MPYPTLGRPPPTIPQAIAEFCEREKASLTSEQRHKLRALILDLVIEAEQRGHRATLRDAARAKA